MVALTQDITFFRLVITSEMPKRAIISGVVVSAVLLAAAPLFLVRHLQPGLFSSIYTNQRRIESTERIWAFPRRRRAVFALSQGWLA